MQHKNPDTINKIENFIDSYFISTGIIPTNMEISVGTNLSTATVSRYLAKMQEDGILEIWGHRSIKTSRMLKKEKGTLEIPLVGKIAFGKPIYAEENIEDYFPIPKKWLTGQDYFFLIAHGENMTCVGIDEGDLVLIEKTNNANNGDIVAALIGNEIALKKVFFEKRSIRFYPENPKYKDIHINDCSIQGIARKVIKNL